MHPCKFEPQLNMNDNNQPDSALLCAYLLSQRCHLRFLRPDLVHLQAYALHVAAACCHKLHLQHAVYVKHSALVSAVACPDRKHYCTASACNAFPRCVRKGSWVFAAIVLTMQTLCMHAFWQCKCCWLRLPSAAHCWPLAGSGMHVCC